MSEVTTTAPSTQHVSSSPGPAKTSRLRGKFNHAKKLDSAVDFVKSTTADQKLPNGPSPPVRMGASPNVGGFSENFVTSIFSQAIVSTSSGTTSNKKAQGATSVSSSDMSSQKK